MTYAGQLRATVTAFGRGALLLDVQISQLAAGRLDHSDAVRACVVACAGVSIHLPLSS